jgi:hypothetical protein
MPFKNHYLKKIISEINPDTDLKVKLIGFVVDKKGETMVLDDGSGKVSAFIDAPDIMEKIKINQLIRVFGSTLPTESGFEIKVDLIQDLTNLNINLYKKVEELYKEMGV